MTTDGSYVWQQPDGSWRGSTPRLPGYAAQALTERAARRRVQDALSAHAASMGLLEPRLPSGVPAPPARSRDGSLPVYFGSPDPRLRDPSKTAGFAGWVPADDVSRKLVRCLEGLRDVETVFELMRLGSADIPDRRKVKVLVPSLYNLATAVSDHFNFLSGNKALAARLDSGTLTEVCAHKREFEKRVPLTAGAPLRSVRNKISAHLDERAVASPTELWAQVNMHTYLRWLKECLKELTYLTGLDLYTWMCDGGHSNLWTMMFSDGMATNFLVEDGKAVYILNSMLMRSPKYGISAEVEGVALGWNELARRCGLQDELIAWNTWRKVSGFRNPAGFR
jgi:predicted RNase H-like HicB family nuclease